MNSVSIIINGVRYDSHIEDMGIECDTCDLKEICDKCPNESFNQVCIELLYRGYNFKKSDKKFEK